MNAGCVISDSKFQFPNGQIINKFIVVLCGYGSDWLVAQTTRQELDKNRTPGCQVNDTPPNFYLPRGGGILNEDTWIRLDEVFEYNSDTFFFKKKDNVAYLKDTISKPLMKDILQCALKSEDIDLFYLEFLEREYDSL